MIEQYLTFTNGPDGWEIEGELDRHNASSLRAWCVQIENVNEPRTLELSGLELLGSEALTAAIESIRLLLQRTPALTIIHAPHLLSHTLYRLGMLEPGMRLNLVAPRQEEPYG